MIPGVDFFAIKSFPFSEGWISVLIASFSYLCIFFTSDICSAVMFRFLRQRLLTSYTLSSTLCRQTASDLFETLPQDRSKRNQSSNHKFLYKSFAYSQY